MKFIVPFKLIFFFPYSIFVAISVTDTLLKHSVEDATLLSSIWVQSQQHPGKENIKKKILHSIEIYLRRIEVHFSSLFV
jgi:hypothetical protein